MLVNIEELKPSRYADTISKSEPETWGNYPNLQLRIWGGQELSGVGILKSSDIEIRIWLSDKIQVDIGAKYLYHKRAGRMETNCRRTYAAFEYPASKRLSFVEFRHGHRSFMWFDFRLK
jgi:hypothetical protein